jgi:hypothetical protein
MQTDGPGDTPEELERLAEDWIALWQSEISALAADREMAEGWAAGPRNARRWPPAGCGRL